LCSVADSIELPLKSIEKSASIIRLPFLQFPERYKSSCELVVEFRRRYHSIHVVFSQRELECFSTADRADRLRCREDTRYLKKLIFPLERKIVNFNLNIGAEHLNYKVISLDNEILLNFTFSIDRGTGSLTRCHDVVDYST
jgi:hypothetical protein